MTIDKSISDTVSLSKILDELIDTGTNPSTIYNFIKMHESDVDDMFNHSLYVTRMYQLDFILSCPSEIVEDLVHFLFESDPHEKYKLGAKTHLCWQLLRSKSKKAQRIAYDMRKFLISIIDENRLRHPYSSVFGKTAQIFDDKLFSASEQNSFCDEMNSWSLDAFKEYLTICRHSLFIGRFLQSDVFLNLDELKQYVILKESNNHPDPIFEQLLIQILDSNCHIDMKKMALEANKKIEYEYPNESPMHQYLSCKKFSELYLKLVLDGKFDWMDIILEELRMNRLKILTEWISYDRDGFNESFNVSDLVEALVGEKNKNQKKKGKAKCQ